MTCLLQPGIESHFSLPLAGNVIGVPFPCTGVKQCSDGLHTDPMALPDLREINLPPFRLPQPQR
jgi:hypothetical protein